MVDIFEYLWSILIKYKLIYVFVSIGYWYNSFVMILVVMKKMEIFIFDEYLVCSFVYNKRLYYCEV